MSGAASGGMRSWCGRVWMMGEPRWPKWRGPCACGCGRAGQNGHHVIYRQELRRRAERGPGGVSYRALIVDRRNLVPMAFDCHGAHHARSRVLAMHRLPDSVFEFAREVLGVGPAWVYLSRHYAGHDDRLDALVGYSPTEIERGLNRPPA